MPCTFRIEQPKEGEKGVWRRGREEHTDEVGVIRREFVVQLDGVRLVDGVPKRSPASDNGVDVFRVGIPGKGRDNGE